MRHLSADRREAIWRFAAWAVGSMELASLLYGVGTDDPLTIAVVAVLLFAVAALACFLPAWRSTRLDPMEALRSQ